MTCQKEYGFLSHIPYMNPLHSGFDLNNTSKSFETMGHSYTVQNFLNSNKWGYFLSRAIFLKLAALLRVHQTGDSSS